VGQGIRSALVSGRSAGNAVTLFGCVVASGAIVAAVVFGVTLTRLIDQPQRFGWPWDVAVITGDGYGDTDTEVVSTALNADPNVDGYSFFAFDSSIRIADQPVAALYGVPGRDATRFPIVDGRNATRPGEAVLGSTTAAQLGVAIGDFLPIETDLLDLDEIEVVGTAVLPSLGSFIADRAGLGLGAFVLADTVTAEDGGWTTLTAIRLRPGVDAGAFLEGLRPGLSTWDAFGVPPTIHSSAIRPPEIVNIDTMRGVPLALGILLGLALVVGLAVSTSVSVHDRRHELAVLRALGFSRRSLYATVTSQALTTIAIGLIIGTPLGIVAGRVAWRAFADQLGVLPRADLPITWITLVAVVAVALTLLAALPPARTAARISPSEVLPRA
jgi:hypothetical protein